MPRLKPLYVQVIIGILAPQTGVAHLVTHAAGR